MTAPAVGPFAVEVWAEGVAERFELAALVEAVVSMVEVVDRASHLVYAIGAVRDVEGRLVAAADNQGRTWSHLDTAAALSVLS